MTIEEIIMEAKKNPEQILNLFTKDEFKIAKAFFGEENIDKFYDDGGIIHNDFGGKMEYPYNEGASFYWTGAKYIYYLQKMILEKNPINYIDNFYN